MITLQDIAKKFGISVATVSNALSGKGRMRDELREKIITAAAEVGYASPNSAKPEIKNKFIVIAEDISVSFCSDIVGGLTEYCGEIGVPCPLYSLGTCKTYGPAAEESVLREKISSLLGKLSPEILSGIIFVANTPRKFEGLFDGVSCPVVYVYCQCSDGSVCVNYNDRQGARLASSVLISHGAKKIAMFSGLLDSIPMSNRMFGYQLALNDAGIPFDPTILYIGDWTLESGYKLALEMIKNSRESNEPLPDAIFSQNDEMAAGICQAFAENGIKVPDDVEVIGFDDKELAEYTFPQLSTIRPPLAALGREALKVMLSITNDRGDKAKGNIFLPCELVERGTTKRRSESVNLPRTE